MHFTGLASEMANLLPILKDNGLTSERLGKVDDGVIWELLASMNIAPSSRLELIAAAKTRVDLIYLQGSACKATDLPSPATQRPLHPPHTPLPLSVRYRHSDREKRKARAREMARERENEWEAGSVANSRFISTRIWRQYPCGRRGLY